MSLLFFVNLGEAQTIYTDDWYYAYNDTNDYSEEVGFRSYSYYVHPSVYLDTGTAADLLPQESLTPFNYEVLLGEQVIAGNADLQNRYSVIWNATQISKTVWTDLFIMELAEWSAPKVHLESIALSSYFHASAYNIASLEFYIYTGEEPSSSTWFDDVEHWERIGFYEGMGYDSNGVKTAFIDLDNTIGGRYLRVVARNNVDPSVKHFGLGGVLITHAAIPEPGSISLSILVLGGYFLWSGRRRFRKGCAE